MSIMFHRYETAVDLSLTKCEVCGDLARERHSSGGVCEVDRRSRTMCKYCRLQKCLRVGMTINGLQQVSSNSQQMSFPTYTNEFQSHMF